MLCLRRLIYSCFVFCAFIFTSCFFLSSPSYAISQVITIDSTNYTSNQFFYSSSSYITSLLSFQPVYVEVVPSMFLTRNNCGSNGYGYLSYATGISGGSVSNVRPILCPYTMVPLSLDLTNVYGQGDTIYYNSGQVNPFFQNNPDFTITYTFYDSVPSCDCPTPDPCPDVPENPYDDKLDELIHAVYVVGAILLVIYFFYIMYSWYIRS